MSACACIRMVMLRAGGTPGSFCKWGAFTVPAPPVFYRTSAAWQPLCVRTYACSHSGQKQPNQCRQSTYVRTQIFLFPSKRPQLPGTHVCTHLFGLVEKDEISRISADRNILHPSAPKPYVHRNSNKCQFGIRKVQLCVRR